jgi:hypothetical protein
MTTLQVTQNAEQAFKNFALSYSNDGDVKFAVECAGDFLDTIEDVNDFEKMLALFLAGKYETTVERMNDDCTFRSEKVKYAA